MILLVSVTSILLLGIEELEVQLEEPLSTFPMQGFYNNSYNNAHNINGWSPNKGKKNVDRGTVAKQDASDVGTGGGILLEGGGEDGARYLLAYPQIPLGGSNRAHNNRQYDKDNGMDMDMNMDKK